MWTQERIALLTSMAAAGATSTSIAQALGEGFTRNSVIGKCCRMGIRLGRADKLKIQVWSQERIDLLRAMCAEKKTSAEIAQACNQLLGSHLTDGSVRARASMMGLHVGSGAERARRASEAAAAAAAANAAKRRREERQTLIAATPEGGVRLTDILHGQCRWPIGEPRDVDGFRFCGAAVVKEASPYCMAHHALAYVPQSDKRRSVDQSRAANASIALRMRAILNSYS